MQAVRHSGPSRRKPSSIGGGFTLAEMLVVMAVIMVLVALLIPALSHARFTSRVTVCLNQYRQWGVATGVYASDDGRGRLPSYRLPIADMSFIDPWIVAHEMVTNMAKHGVTVPMWFCPTRRSALDQRRDNFRLLRARELMTPADLVDESLNFQKAAYSWGDLMWWVPRPLGEGLEFPDPTQLHTRTPDPWPQRLDDRTIASQPIISDWLLGVWNANGQTMEIPDNAGGHQWAGSLKGLNLGFADGHVEKRSRPMLKWQARRVGGPVYVY
jgi:prepilin-type processing-associated H-X9-DG protein